MVLLGNIRALCLRSICCCKSNPKEDTPSQPAKSTTESTPCPIWTTDVANYDATSTITTSEAEAACRTGIINHNFLPPGTKPSTNLPDVTADITASSPAFLSTFTQQQICDQYCCHHDKAVDDEWYFSGNFTQGPQKPKEVTEL